MWCWRGMVFKHSGGRSDGPTAARFKIDEPRSQLPRNCQFYGRFISGHRTSLVRAAPPASTHNPFCDRCSSVQIFLPETNTVRQTVILQNNITFAESLGLLQKEPLYFFHEWCYETLSRWWHIKFTLYVSVLSESFPLKSSTNALKALSRTNPKPFSCNQKPRVLGAGGPTWCLWKRLGI